MQFLRRQLFTPKLAFEDLESLNAWLNLRCDALGSRRHPERQDHTVDAIFSEEKADLRPLGRAFDGYVPSQRCKHRLPGDGEDCAGAIHLPGSIRQHTITRQVIAGNHREGATAFRPVLQASVSRCGPMPVVLWLLPLKT